MNRWLSSTVETYLKHYGTAKNPIVYDVGSRDGRDGVELAQRISENQIDFKNIVLFECNPPQIEIIKQNYPQATLITEAISDVPNKTVEFLQIHGNDNERGSSTLNLNRNDKWIKSTSTVGVKTRRLDDVIESLGHTEIDIMKIDIEGFTHEALQSLGKYLRNVKVFHLETEIPGYARNKTTQDIILHMTEQGYTCTANDSEWSPQIIDLVWVRNDV